MKETFEFEAIIQAGDGGGAFVFFPFDMLESFGTTGKVLVQGDVDGVPYSGKLLKYGFPQHILGLLKSVRSQIGKMPGDTVKITLRRNGGVDRRRRVPICFHERLSRSSVTALPMASGSSVYPFGI